MQLTEHACRQSLAPFIFPAGYFRCRSDCTSLGCPEGDGGWDQKFQKLEHLTATRQQRFVSMWAEKSKCSKQVFSPTSKRSTMKITQAQAKQLLTFVFGKRSKLAAQNTRRRYQLVDARLLGFVFPKSPCFAE